MRGIDTVDVDAAKTGHFIFDQTRPGNLLFMIDPKLALMERAALLQLVLMRHSPDTSFLIKRSLETVF